MEMQRVVVGHGGRERGGSGGGHGGREGGGKEEREGWVGCEFFFNERGAHMSDYVEKEGPLDNIDGQDGDTEKEEEKKASEDIWIRNLMLIILKYI